jgi:hypothetical protein
LSRSWEVHAPTKEEVKKNIVHAEKVAMQILLQGGIPVIPHKITSFFDLDPRFKSWSKDAWLVRFCFPLLSRCDAICMCKGWEHSTGARAEFDFAVLHDMIILKTKTAPATNRIE